MSRIGKLPIAVPNGVTVNIDGQAVSVKGPKGQLSLTLVDEVSIGQGEDGIEVQPRDDSKRARSMWGMQRTLVQNLVDGVAEGFKKNLEITGVGYRAQAQGQKLQLALGFSHDVVYDVPEGVQVATPKPTEIEISGIDKQKVGQVAAEIRAYRPPEPYKGKGVRYSDEYIFRKEGKKK
ncbi:50S ribosomal protein L6 [Tepidicaulis sp. LMO-SS28]|uniref:50S ribosomal protein L6 n=1 Tax=Tepidicaulis sp. LMO-SS28 TaxID=3447455 RepID=UPI003EE296C3